jgi:cobyric acid synthase
MPSVELSENEWGQVMNILATKETWANANPLLLKMGEQLRQQVLMEHAARAQAESRQNNPPNLADYIPGNGKEAHHE